MTPVSEQRRQKMNAQVAQEALCDQLEYEVTGLMKDARLDFDQRVQYSIARSLKQLCDHVDEIRREKTR